MDDKNAKPMPLCSGCGGVLGFELRDRFVIGGIRFSERALVCTGCGHCFMAEAMFPHGQIPQAAYDADGEITPALTEQTGGR